MEIDCYNSHLHNRQAELDQVQAQLQEKQGELELSIVKIPVTKDSSFSKMRIAVDLTPLRPGGENGGAKVLVLNLLKQFQTLAPHYQFLLLTAPWNHTDLLQYENKNTKCLLIKDLTDQDSPIKFQLVYLKLLYYFNKVRSKIDKGILSKPLLIKHKVNLLFCPFSAPTYVEDGLPVVAIAYDLQHLDYPFFFSIQEQQHRTNFIKNVLKHSQKIVCISEFTRQSLIKYFNAELSQLVVVPISIHNRLPKLNEETVIEHLQKLGLAGKKYAFYPANYWPHKNHQMLLTAYGMYREQCPDQCLDLVFTGALEQEENHLREAVTVMGLEDNVQLLGFLSEEALVAVLQGCKCLIFPSLYEGFGIPVLEAMKFGKPVLSSNTSSLLEVGGDAVIYFDPRKPDKIASSLAQISSNQALVDELVDKGYRRLKLFDDEKMAYEYLKIFKTVAFNGQKSSKPSITGIYGDGWSAPEFYITVAAGLAEQTLILTVEAPEFYPASKAEIKLKSKYKQNLYSCIRGESKEIVWPVLANSELITVQIKPSFNPKKLAINSDERQLGIIVRGCKIKLVDGTFHSLLMLESVQ